MNLSGNQKMNRQVSKLPSASFDQIKVKRNLVAILAFFISIILAFLALKTGNVLYIASLVALPFGLILISRPDIAFVLSVILDATTIKIQNNDALALGVIMQIFIILILSVSRLIKGRNVKHNTFPEKQPLIWFALIVIMLMVGRGSGLRFLGSETWGGMIYVKYFISAFFYIYIGSIFLSKKLIKYIIIGTIFAGILGSLSAFSGWSAGVKESFTNIGAPSATSMRLIWVTPFVYALFPIILAIRPKLPIVKVIAWMFLLIAIGLTGFRTRIVVLLLVTFIFGFFLTISKKRYFIKCAVAALSLWMFFIIISPFVKGGISRAISFLPGVKTEYMMSADADNSVTWRFEIWRYCWERAPEFFWLGRGSAFDVYNAVDNMSRNDILTFSPLFAYTTRSYHSGPLALLIDYGFPGFIVGSWLLISIGLSSWKIAVRMRQYDTLESRYCIALASWLIWEVMSFYLVYGQMPKFVRIIIAAAVLKVLSQSIHKIYKPKKLET